MGRLAKIHLQCTMLSLTKNRMRNTNWRSICTTSEQKSKTRDIELMLQGIILDVLCSSASWGAHYSLWDVLLVCIGSSLRENKFKTVVRDANIPGQAAYCRRRATMSSSLLAFSFSRSSDIFAICFLCFLLARDFPCRTCVFRSWSIDCNFPSTPWNKDCRTSVLSGDIFECNDGL